MLFTCEFDTYRGRMPETRKPARYKAAHRKPAWLHNSAPATHLIRILRLIAAIALAATRKTRSILHHGVQGLRRHGPVYASRTLESAQRHATTAYRSVATRVVDLTTRVRDSRLGVGVTSTVQRMATTVHGHVATARDSALVHNVERRTRHYVDVTKDSRVGRLTRQGIATVKTTARRHTPDWAVDRIRNGRTAWNTAVADNRAPAYLGRAMAGVAVIALGAVVLMGSPTTTGSPTPTAAGVPTERNIEDEANRSQDRDDPEAPAPGDAETAQPAPETEEEPEPPAEPEPVGGLNADQMANAVEIVRIGQDMGISERGQAVALVTAMQESQLLVLANTGIPESLDIPNQGSGQDHDSVGLFQQRPSSGWGSVEECMDVEYSTTVFYKSLKRIKGWEKMDLTVAAQSVQVSAFPDHYAKWEGLAWDIIDEVNG